MTDRLSASDPDDIRAWLLERLDEPAPGRPSERDAQIRPTDITDEQRIARQDGVWFVAALVGIEHQDRNRFRRVTWGLERGETDSAELNRVAVMKRRELVLGLCGSAKVNARARSIAKLEMAGEEIGVKVRQHDVANVEAVLGSERKVLINVTLRVDDNRGVRALVANEIGGVRQTTQVELLQDHACPPLRPSMGRSGLPHPPQITCPPQ